METNNITDPISRQCGSCYSCCVHLGITELKKYPTQACKYLDGKDNSEKRCSIYITKPRACNTYRCAWLEGLGDENQQPNLSGLLITAYEDKENPFPHFTATIIIIDDNISGDISQGNLNSAIKDLFNLGYCTQIRVVNYKTRKMIFFHKGNIYNAILAPREKGEYEALSFITTNPPVGHYEIRKIQ